MCTINIAGREIGDGQPTFIIAECGINHEGSLDKAKLLVEKSKKIGANCVKFQKRSIKKLYSPRVLANMENQEQGVQYIYRYIKRFELSDEDFVDLKKYCDDIDIMMSCTPFDEESLEFLETLNLPFYKIGSPTFNDIFLLAKMISKERPLIVSTGMSTIDEIEAGVSLLSHDLKIKDRFALLHCVSSYPCEFAELNLRFIQTLKEKFNVPIGYSGHERGISTALAAVVMGASVVEKHLTLDRCSDNPDNRVSIEPGAFQKMVRDIRNFERSLGTGKKYLTRSEYQTREALSKSLVATKTIQEGEAFTLNNMGAQVPGNGLSSHYSTMAVGKHAQRKIMRGEQISGFDIGILDMVSDVKYPYQFGIIARFSDMEKMSWQNPKVYEFHLTDSDLENHFPGRKYDCLYSVHMPEYFGSSLIDIATENKENRLLSLDIINRTIDVAISLLPFFNSEKPKVVIHPGGGFIHKNGNAKQALINFYDSYHSLRRPDVELFVENLPPFPIYFGGVWYQEIFMDPNEIIDFCRKTDSKICYDISHAGLACNYFGWDLVEYTKTLAPYIGHLHIADYSGIAGEGLQIEDGECDFKKTIPLLPYKNVPCLMEVWRGHKNSGYGFAEGMKRLNKYLS